MTDQTALAALCDASDVTEDAPLRVEQDGQEYAVYRYDGTYYVTQDLCSHGPGYLSEGHVDDCEVVCPFHQGRFNFITGEATMAPCTEALRTWTAHVRDGQICIDPAQPATL
jgi:nitrite reductase/ring-hydroxylating ferredoxin subunit